MTCDPNADANVLWSVQLLISGVPRVDRPLRHTSWHPTKAAAIAYAQSREAKGHKIISIRGWREAEYIDWNARQSNEDKGQ